MKSNIIEEVSTLTTIKDKTLESLLEKVVWCISDSVAKASEMNDEFVSVDIGIGTLNIDLSNENQIRYKFIPSKVLENEVRNSFINKTNLLNLNIEKSLVYRIENNYKDLF